jgi:hypothetical protein
VSGTTLLETTMVVRRKYNRTGALVCTASQQIHFGRDRRD